MRFIQSNGGKLRDDDAERARRNHDERITQLQKVPIVGGTEVLDLELPNATDVYVSHGLGHRPRCVVSPPRAPTSTGRIVDRTLALGVDRDRYIVLRATGWGATVTVDLWIW